MITIKNIPNDDLVRILTMHHACDEGLSFIGDRDLKSAWRDLEYFAWFRWFLSEMHGRGDLPTWERWKEIESEPRRLYLERKQKARERRDRAYEAARDKHQTWCEANRVDRWCENESRSEYERVAAEATNEYAAEIKAALAERIARIRALVEIVE